MRKTLLGFSIVLGGVVAARAQGDILADKAKLDSLYDGIGVASASPQGAFGRLKIVGRSLKADARGHDRHNGDRNHGRRGYGRQDDRRPKREHARPIVIIREPRQTYERPSNGGGTMSGTALAVLGGILLAVILLALL